MDSLWDRFFPETPFHERYVTHEWLPSIDLKETKDEHHFFVERYAGTFERKVKLPALVKTDKVDATFDKGVLTINLPKSEEAKKKEIKIKVH